MNLTNEFHTIRVWAAEKGIFQQSSIHRQLDKLEEEHNELKQAVMFNNKEEIFDAIGDMCVVLTNLAELAGMPIEQCINGAYEVIKNRTGKMIGGTFVKDK